MECRSPSDISKDWLLSEASPPERRPKANLAKAPGLAIHHAMIVSSSQAPAEIRLLRMKSNIQRLLPLMLKILPALLLSCAVAVAVESSIPFANEKPVPAEKFEALKNIDVSGFDFDKPLGEFVEYLGAELRKKNIQLCVSYRADKLSEATARFAEPAKVLLASSIELVEERKARGDVGMSAFAVLVALSSPGNGWIGASGDRIYVHFLDTPPLTPEEEQEFMDEIKRSLDQNEEKK